MQIELDQEVQDALERAAAGAGMSRSGYANLILQERLAQGRQSAQRRSDTVDRLIELLQRSAASSGRNGREWRDFIHEGH
jgi:hypothetical protein